VIELSDADELAGGSPWKQQGDLLPPDTPASIDRAAKRGARRIHNRVVLRGIQQLDWLPKSTRMCGTRARGATPEVCRSAHGTAVWRGLAHCKNLRACPVCLAYRMGQWRDQLIDLMHAVRDRGGCCVLVTYTLRHGVGDDIALLRKLLGASQRRMVSGRRWVQLAKEIGYLGQARTVEVTYGHHSGYHPHTHALLFLEKPLDDNALNRLRANMGMRWIQTVDKVSQDMGIDVGLPDFEHGCRLDYGNNAAEYLTKMGFPDELTDAGTKEGRGDNRSMARIAWELVQARQLKWIDSRRNERIWKGYVEGMKGFKPFWLARGLVEKVNALPLLPDVPPELAHTAGEVDELPDAQLVYAFGPREWLRLRRSGPIAIATVERLVEAGADGPIIEHYITGLPWEIGPIIRDPLYGMDERWNDLDRRPSDGTVY
jgi:Replication protein